MNKIIIQIGKWLPIVLLVFVILSGNNLSTEAHSPLKKTFPEGNAALEDPPESIDVWFQDPVVIHPGSIKVMNGDGVQIPVTQSRQDPENKGHIAVQPIKELPSGHYTVEISVVAQDGYVIEESFQFSINQPAKEAEQELELVDANITDGEILSSSPEEIELQFNQPAEVVAFGVFDKHSRSVAVGEPQSIPDNPRLISVPFQEELAAGTYQITWYAAPAPGIDMAQYDQQGVYYFAVEEFSSMVPVESNESFLNYNYFDVSFGIKQLAYWLTFVGFTALFGIAWFYSIIFREKMKQRSSRKVSLFFYCLGLIGVILLLVTQRQELPRLSLQEFWLLKFNWIPVTQLLLLTVGLLVRKGRLFLFGISLMLWPFIIGHASYPRYGGYFTMTATALHILAVGIWIGGLIALLVKPKQTEAEEWIKQTAPAFSKWALISVITIALSGIWMAVAFLPSFSWESFVKSEWGISLLIKIILFLFLIILGYFQRRLLRQLGSRFSNSFFKRIRIEVMYGIIVLFFAATLVMASPGAAEQAVYSEGSGQHDLGLSVEVTPLEIGINTITLDFQENLDIEQVNVGLNMPPDWQVENEAFKVEEGTYKLTGNLLHAAGTINMEVKVLLRNGEKVEIPYRIVVPGEVRFNE